MDSRSGWVEVKVQPQKGYWLKASGDWTVDRRSLPHVWANGFPSRDDKKIFQGCKFAPSLTYGHLLGKIGPHGKVFNVGTWKHVKGDGTGVLYLRINDLDRCLGDNEGAITVTMT